MKKIIAYFAFILLIFIACKDKTDNSETGAEKDSQTQMVTGDNSQNALDWAGVYRGTLPCADCEGISTQVILNEDLTYTKRERYEGKSDEIIQTNGTFSWDDAGNNITLNSADGGQYKVGEIALMVLDKNGKRITGSLSDQYNLKKVAMDNSITEKYWKLIEMNGQTITLGENQKKDIHLILKVKDSLATGFGGCNSYSGSYTLDENTNSLSFSRMRTTLMACEILKTEDMFHELLGKSDNYLINNDTLSLGENKKAYPLKFVAIYLN